MRNIVDWTFEQVCLLYQMIMADGLSRPYHDYRAIAEAINRHDVGAPRDENGVRAKWRTCTASSGSAPTRDSPTATTTGRCSSCPSVSTTRNSSIKSAPASRRRLPRRERHGTAPEGRPVPPADGRLRPDAGGGSGADASHLAGQRGLEWDSFTTFSPS